MYINYSDLPGFSNLYLDYVYEFENVKQFYHWNFRDLNSYKTVFESLKNTDRPHRKIIGDIISEQYENDTISEKTEENISLLKNENTVAIVTGQQLGIFGGPLYTIYKTITAIKLAKSLKENFNDYNFVPVFWLEGDDHDFEEVSYSNFIDKNNNLKKVIYDDGRSLENRGPMSRQRFTDNIDEILTEVENSLRDNDFKSELMDFLKSGYGKGKTFFESFRKLLLNLFDDDGLIIFNPQTDEVKKILKPIFGRELELYKENTINVLQKSAELDDLYHAQVKVKPINLFYNSQDGRYLIEPADDGLYRLKSKRTKISLEEFLDRLEESPENFSPNVLLRPICQDFLLPTGVYVGGPGEIAYFAQVNPLYNSFEIVPPIIYPRASVTILEKNIVNILEKYSLKLNEIFLEDDYLTNKVIGKVSQENLEDKFDEVTENIKEILENLQNDLIDLDKQLESISTKTKERILQSLNNLKSKSFASQKRKYETALNQIQKIITNIYPERVMQERELSLIYFASKYGINFFKEIANEISINKFEHQIIEI